MRHGTGVIVAKQIASKATKKTGAFRDAAVKVRLYFSRKQSVLKQFSIVKGVLNPNFRLFKFELKKIQFLK